MGTKQKLDFYFSFISLYTYIGYEAFEALVQKYALEVTYKPIDLHAIFTASGGLPVTKRPPQRQAYRFVEMQRWAIARNIPLVLKPKHHPSDPVPARDHVGLRCSGLRHLHGVSAAKGRTRIPGPTQ